MAALTAPQAPIHRCSRRTNRKAMTGRFGANAVEFIGSTIGVAGGCKSCLPFTAIDIVRTVIRIVLNRN
jgi:hypothetical protein